MAKFKDVITKDPDRRYHCDLCEETFPIKDLRLTDPIDRIKMCTPSARYRFVNKDGEVMESTQQPSHEKGDRMLTCPLCDAQHPFGFMLASDPRIVKVMGHA